ncbi:type II secretion system F family protein [Nocardioides sp. C4-1]|uniref:type II secretion system F family protein n=1 Tax=Nocardioides sp. C4-1 TaxID=3151851 RepID=UPI003266DA88
MTATTWTLVAAVCAAAAVVAAAPPRVRAVRRAGASRWGLAVVALPVVVLVGGASPRLVALACVAAVVTPVARRLWQARARRLAAAVTAGRVLETCEALAAELSAGRPPAVALDRAALDWPALATVAEAHRVGADVPVAWRNLATVPGAADLRVVAAAWQVSSRTGEGLADTLERVAVGLRDAQATARVVRGELSSARATARLVAVLPLLALAMGNGAGGDPWGFLLGHPVGLGCLVLGLALMLAGLAWIEALAREVDR